MCRTHVVCIDDEKTSSSVLKKTIPVPFPKTTRSQEKSGTFWQGEIKALLLEGAGPGTKTLQSIRQKGMSP